jgi:hypothetical protein
MLLLILELKTRSVKGEQKPQLNERPKASEKVVKKKKHNEKKPQRRKIKNRDLKLSVPVLTPPHNHNHEQSQSDGTLHQLGQDQIQGLDLS